MGSRRRHINAGALSRHDGSATDVAAAPAAAAAQPPLHARYRVPRAPSLRPLQLRLPRVQLGGSGFATFRMVDARFSPKFVQFALKAALRTSAPAEAPAARQH